MALGLAAKAVEASSSRSSARSAKIKINIATK